MRSSMGHGEPAEGLSVIALHGLALSPDEIDRMVAPVVQHVGFPGVRWLFPKAPRRPVTILGGRPALAWYDILAYDRSRMDESGIEDATAALCQEVREERQRGPRRRIALVGFSQGGALALNAGLRLQEEVDGIVALGTAVPFPERVVPATPQSPPIFFGHGFFDRLVPHAVGRESCGFLGTRGYETEWRSYACGHSVTRRLLRDVSSWLQTRVLGEGAAPAASPAPVGRGRMLPHLAWISR